MGPMGPRGMSGRDGAPPGYPPYSTPAAGIIPSPMNANLSTIGMENSFQFLGESLLHLAQFQQNVNRNMASHLLDTAKSQRKQKEALEALVENTRQREFDKLFDAIPLYDGEDPDKFEPWLSQLENACVVGKRDIREVAICSSVGPVLEVLKSINEGEDWATHRTSCGAVSPLIKQECTQQIYSAISESSMPRKICALLSTSTLRCTVRPRD